MSNRYGLRRFYRRGTEVVAQTHWYDNKDDRDIAYRISFGNRFHMTGQGWLFDVKKISEYIPLAERTPCNVGGEDWAKLIEEV